MSAKASLQANKYVFLRHILRRFLRPRLHMTIITAFLCAVVVAEVIWLVPATILERNERLDNMKREIHMMVRASVDHTSFPTIDTEIAIGERLMTMSPLKGGMFFNAIGNPIRSFGAPVQTSPETVLFDHSNYWMLDFNTMEVVFLDSETGLPHHLLARIDVTEVNKAVITHIIRSAISILAIIGFSMVVLFLIVHFMILRPLNLLRNAAIYAIESPEYADEHITNLNRGDEIGDLSKALDQLFFGMSLTYREDLLVLESMIQTSAIAIVTYRKDGTMYSANNGALKLFGVNSLAELQGLDQNFLSFKSASKPQSLMSTLDKGDYRGQCRLLTKRGERPILIAATTHRDDSNRILRHSMFVVDISRYVEIIDEQAVQIAQHDSVRSGLRAQIAELKLGFESCMLTMQQDQPNYRPALDKTTVMPDRSISSWLSTFSHNEEDNLFHESLPPVLGSEMEMRNVFRQALTFVQLKSIYNKPNISIGARVTETEAIFTITDETKKNQPIRKSNDPAHVAWPLAMKAFMTSLKSQQGKVVKIDRGEMPFVVFAVPLDVDAYRENRAA